MKIDFDDDIEANLVALVILLLLLNTLLAAILMLGWNILVVGIFSFLPTIDFFLSWVIVFVVFYGTMHE